MACGPLTLKNVRGSWGHGPHTHALGHGPSYPVPRYGSGARKPSSMGVARSEGSEIPNFTHFCVENRRFWRAAPPGQ